MGIRIDVFTLFPEMFTGVLETSMLKRAAEMGELTVNLHDFRKYSQDKHNTVDDTPYGGGGGMVLKPEPITAAIEDVLGPDNAIPVIMMTPQGEVFTQNIAFELAALDRFAIFCGHYEGLDERARQLIVTREISIGDYVLTGGELAAMVVIDAVTRLQPGVLGDPEGPYDDSHATGLLEYPHYTRPQDFRGLEVPGVLLSGHQVKITRWRREQALRRTWQRRPELLLTAPLDAADRATLLQLASEDSEIQEKNDA